MAPPEHEVILTSDKIPSFPSSCLVCGRDHPGQTITLRTRDFHWKDFWWPLGYFFRPVFKVQAPVCPGCKTHWGWKKFFQNAAGLILFVAILVALAMFFVGMKWKPRRFIKKTIFFVACLGAYGLLYRVLWPFFFRPLPLEIALDGEEATYTFTDSDYALAFERLNLPFRGFSSEREREETDPE